MARINLLPWRQDERERRNKEFITLVVAVTLLSLLAAFAAWSYFNNELDDQFDANVLVEQKNVRLDGVLTEIDSLEQRREDIISRRLFRACKDGALYQYVYGMIWQRQCRQRFI